MKHDDVARKRAEDAPVEAAREHPLVEMQKAVGNAAVARLLAQRQGPGEEEEMLQGKHDPALMREEEEMEEESVEAKHDPAIAREGEEEEMAAKHDGAAPSVGLEGGPVGSEIEGTIADERGGGSALPGATRDKMEGAFGTSFGDVRVHSGETADALNRQVTAKAFTTGSDIFLRKDSSPGDEKLLAHELTHVVQQRSMGGAGGGGMSVGAAGSDHEQEADAIASEVTSGAVARHVEDQQ
jgi:hypothetical protein